MFRVSVPATSANIGAGFDSLGVALSLYSEYEFNEEEIQANIDWCESYMPKYEFFTEKLVNIL